MKMFRVVVSSDAAEFEELVNRAIDEGYIFLEGTQTLIVDKQPTQFQFVRQMLHKSYTYLSSMNKMEQELKSSMEFTHANREVLIQARALQGEVEDAAWKIKMKRKEKLGE